MHFFRKIRETVSLRLILTTLASMSVGALLMFLFISSRPTDGTSTGTNADTKTTLQEELVIFEKREVIEKRPNGYNTQKISGFAMDTSGERNLIYQFIDDPLKRVKSKRFLIPTGHITKDNNIYLSGVGKDVFAVLSPTGENLTEEYLFLKDARLPLKNFIRLPESEKIAYTETGLVVITEPGNNKGKTPVFISLSRAETPEVMGWSSQPNILYAVTNGKSHIYRINTDSKRAYALKASGGSLENTLHLCPSQDYAIALHRTLDPETDSAIPPFQFKKINLSADTGTVFFEKLEQKPTAIFLSCAGGKMLYKDNTGFHILNLDGKEYRNKITEKETIFAFLNDGKHVVTEQDGRLLIKNYKSGAEILLGTNEEGVEYRLLGTVL